MQPAPDLLLGVGVVLPARLEVAQLLDPVAGLLLLAPQVGDLGALGDVLRLALDPGFATNNWLYLLHSDKTEKRLDLSRFT
ncbi:hypothetical protein ACWEAF_46925, partial [Streptomyces sp. NPDC005071]